MCLAFQSNCFLKKCQISYRFVKDTRAVPLKHYYKSYSPQILLQGLADPIQDTTNL